MDDAGLAGTMRYEVMVEAYNADRYQDGVLVVPGPPDRIVRFEQFYEADGTPITDDERIAAIRDQQHAKGQANGARE